MAEPSDFIVEEREEWMVSPSVDSAPHLRTAHFLKPSVSPMDEPAIEPPSLSASSLLHKLKPNQRPLDVQFPGWRLRPKMWLEWLNLLHSTYQSVWKQVGIYEAIMNICYEIRRNDGFLFGIAERWNPKTNTFIFPWAEATITLEDVMVLGGYSVLGESVFFPLGTQELREIERKLIQARTETGKSSARKACPLAWMKMFMNSGSEIEHEAFLVAWLSIFVLPDSYLVRRLVFPIAVHLANGNRIALAPAVLAAIYRDLSFLKKATLLSSAQLDDNLGDRDLIVKLKIWSQFQLVQLWGWERFPNLHPKPKPSNCSSYPKFARWHKVKCDKIEDVRLALDFAGEKFLWRPYAAIATSNWTPKFYPEKAKWAMASDLGVEEEEEELHSFARCLRDSQLVGLDCIEQYLPHRVGRQFGLDQDLPSSIILPNKNSESACKFYSKSLGSLKLYIPPRLHEADVTARYFEWWNKSMLGNKVSNKTAVEMESRPKEIKEMKMDSDGKNARHNNADVPPGFPPKSYPLKADIGVPPGFPPKYNTIKSENMMGSDEPIADQTTTFFDKYDDLDKAGSSSSASAVDQDAFTLQNSLSEPMEQSMYEEEAAAVILESSLEDGGVGELECEEENKTWVGSNEGIGYIQGITEVELEARISRLEQMAAELKAARFTNRSEKGLINGSWYGSFQQDEFA